MLEALEDRRTIFVTGKGGVGKSTLVAALGRYLARRGNQTLIVETDAYSAMEDLLEVDLADNAVTAVDPPLHAVNLLNSECVIEAVSRFVPSKRIVRMILNNRVARSFFDTAPGVNQVAILDQVRQYLERTDGDEPRWDHILVDLPASGHAVTFLSVPQTYHDLIKVGPIAEAADDIASIVRDVDDTAIAAVCLPEEMPVNETIELEERLEDSLGRSLTLAFANMVHRSPFHADQREDFRQLVDNLDRDELIAETIAGAAADDRAVERVIAGNALALDWFERDARYLTELEERLEAPIVELPVFYENEGAEIVRRAVEYLEGSETDGTEETPIAS